ncbi:MAG TPA: pyridoxamine 5'-phosphate oxidase family protein [Anaerolineae bacterium]|jgi:PPOX class probable F420-dependent enzyme
MTTFSTTAQARLESEANIWLTSVRPDGRPHLVPAWFAWHAGKLYACIQSTSVKTRNIEQNPHVALALEDGSNVVICEGTASFLPSPWPEAVAAIFAAKYDWDITDAGDYDRLLEITPVKWLDW